MEEGEGEDDGRGSGVIQRRGDEKEKGKMLKMSLILIDSPKKIGRARSANPATAIKA